MDGNLAKTQCDDDLQAIWLEYLAERNDELRNVLVDKYMVLANKIAGYYYSKRIGGQTEFRDYQNLAVIGLIQSIERYELRSDVKFETFASYRIKGSILNSIKNFSEKNAFLTYEQMRTQELIESITDFSEHSPEIGLFEKILEVTLNLSYSALLDISAQYDIDHQSSLTQLDGYHHCEIQDLKRIIKDIISALPKKQQLIVRYYYFYELSFVEISSLVGITKGRVSQIHRQAIENIRKIYNNVVNIEKM